MKIFESYHDALAHEMVCTGPPEGSDALERAEKARDKAKKVIDRAQKFHETNNNKRAKLAHDGAATSSGHAASREDATPGTRIKIEPPSPAQSTPSALVRLSDAATERMERNATSAAGAAPTTTAEKSNQHGAKKKMQKRQNWMCDVCKVAIFEDYGEAVEHEKKCKGPVRVPVSTSRVQGDKQFICKPIGRKGQSTDALAVDDTPKAMAPLVKSPSFQQSCTSAFKRPNPQSTSSTSIESDMCNIRGSASLDVANIMVGMPQSVGSEGVKSTLKGGEGARQFAPTKSIEVVGKGTLINGLAKADVNGAEGAANESMETDEGKAQTKGTNEIGNYGAATRVLKKRRLLSLVLPMFVAVAALQRNGCLWSPFNVIAAFLLLSVVTFGAALIFTHKGQHPHPTQRNWLYEMSVSARDYLFEPEPEPIGEKLHADVTEPPTLREFLAHPDGFHMAFAVRIA